MSRKNFSIEALEIRKFLSAALPASFGKLIIPDVESRGNNSVTRQGPVNGDFSGFPDLTGWQTTGNDFVMAGDFKTIPDGGSTQAVISNAQAPTNGPLPVTASTVESFLGLRSGALGNKAFNGSAIKQNITGKAWDSVSFNVDFFTNEATFGGTGDYGFISVGFNGKTRAYRVTGKLTATNPLDSNGLASETGYQKYTILLPASGTYTIGFGVVNGNGNGASASDLAVSNVQLNSGPVILPHGDGDGHGDGHCDGHGDGRDNRGGWNFESDRNVLG